jgi:hypothetical protein
MALILAHQHPPNGSGSGRRIGSDPRAVQDAQVADKEKSAITHGVLQAVRRG